jgi:adenosine kinase
MSIVICGSLAFDNIAVFPDRFQNHILPDKIHALNVSFLVPELRREYGGTAGNIAFNLRMLAPLCTLTPKIMATVGSDFEPYASRLELMGISQAHVRQIPDQLTAQCFITTDLDDNQITAFHPGAMNFAHLNKITDATDAKIGILSPDGRDAMLQHAEQFAAAGVPFIFDPGQAMPMFEGPDLMRFFEQATYATFNDYEMHMACSRTGKSETELAQMVKALIVTRGKEGSTIYADGQQIQVPVVKAEALVDPTGCGDSYRAGLLVGIANEWSWKKTGQLASLMGAIKIAQRGGQNHAMPFADIQLRYQQAFGESLVE